jgi:hypothetical protein
VFPPEHLAARPSTRRSRWRLTVAFAACLALFAASGASPVGADTTAVTLDTTASVTVDSVLLEPFTKSSGRPFSVWSAFNLPIPADPVIGGRNESIVSYLSSTDRPAVADLYEFGVPIWDASATTPRYQVECTRPWGTCELEQQLVPIPDAAHPSTLDRLGGDGAMVVIDWSTRLAYEFYAAEKIDGAWTAGWGGVVSIDGMGTPGQAVGAGLSRLGGVVRAREIAQGRIDHALVLSSDNVCEESHRFRYPASKTDGRSPRIDCVAEGTRLQLDPSIDIGALPGLSPAERIIGTALQRHGAYVIDNGGAPMAFIFEAPSGEADAYCDAGLCHDYASIDLPWSRLRVLRTWHGGEPGALSSGD